MVSANVCRRTLVTCFASSLTLFFPSDFGWLDLFNVIAIHFEVCLRLSSEGSSRLTIFRFVTRFAFRSLMKTRDLVC